MADSSALAEKGRQALLAGDYFGANATLSEALCQNPNDVDAWFLLGAVRHQMQDLSAAREAFEKVARLDPRHLQARFALAVACLEAGDHHAALVSCEEAIAIAPDDPQACFNLAVAQEAVGSVEQALAGYDRVLSLSPSHAGAFKNRGALLLRLGQNDVAIASAQASAKQLPYSCDAQFNLGSVYLAAYRHAEAASAFSRAVALQPANARALLHAGFALAQCERFDDAQRMLDRAAALDASLLRNYRESIFGREGGAPVDRLDARALFLLRHYDAIERCDWRERDYFIQRFAELIGRADGPPLTERALGFRAMTMGLPMPLQLSLARQLVSGVETGPHEYLPPEGRRSSCSNALRIRIGYVSPDFRDHPTGRVVVDLFSWHDRNRFEIHGYLLGKGDQSEVRRKVESACDKFVDLNGVDDEQAAQMIAGDAIDILVDLAGYTDMSRPGIFARRPAPLQISWLGYVATMGAPWIDYLVADPVAVPAAHERFYSEAPIRMPAGQYLCSYANASIEAPPERVAAGLPETGFVLGAMHNAYKIDPVIFALWMRILAPFDGSVLWLLDCGEEANENLRMVAGEHGINPGRLIFAPRVPHEKHLERMQLVDLVLDTSQCNGSSTIADALVAGVPAIACMGETFAQRMAAGLLRAADQEHLIVHDLQEYEKLAHDFMSNPERLLAARTRVEAARRHALFYRPEDWVRYFESGLVHAWGNHCDGMQPRAIEIEA